MEKKTFVTLGGECFDAEFQGEERDGRRPGSVHLFRLSDLRGGRGEILVSLFGSEQLKLLNPNYSSRIEFVRVNAIRRAFDAGKLDFDAAPHEQMYQSLDLNDSDFQEQPVVADADIRQFMTHKAYWLGYMHPPFRPNEPIDLDTPEDRNYLGAGQADIVRNITRLKNQALLDKVMAGHGRPTETLISAYEANLHSTDSTQTRATLADMSNGQTVTHKGLAVFISHSGKDAELAEALIDMLKSALGIRAEQIRCSSVDGYRLPVGVNTEGKLRDEVNAATVVVGLITPNSLKSAYVMFELGARWGANRFLAPLLAGVQAHELSGPLSLLNALSASNEAQIHQLIGDIGKYLELERQPTESYIRQIAQVKKLAGAVPQPGIPNAVAPVTVKQKLKVSISLDGTPPSQSLKIVANQQVEVSRLEYMLSNETTVAGENVARRGEIFDLPLNHDLVRKIWNTPRQDQNWSDHSGPAKLAITVETDGEGQQCVIPVQLNSLFLNNTAFVQVVGSKTFFGT